jgi:hypothetical protein
MSELITPRDPVTWFSQAPSHPTKPKWLIKRQNAMETAWARYESAIDAGTDPVGLRRLRNLAGEAEDWYRQGCRTHEAIVDRAECGCCTPDQSCPACQPTGDEILY